MARTGLLDMINTCLYCVFGKALTDNLDHFYFQLAHNISLDPRPEYHRASLSWESGSIPTASSTGSQCSSRLLSMKTANALLVLPPRIELQTRLETGSTVKAMLIGPIV